MQSKDTKFYRHFKNKPYKFIGTAKHSETLDEMIVYEARYPNPEGSLWVRPKAMFFEEIKREGKILPRFAPVPVAIETYEKIEDNEIGQIKPVIEKVFGSFDQEGFGGILNNHTKFCLHLGFLDKKCVGFKIGYQKDKTTFYSWLGGVLPEFRGLGVASDLMIAQHEYCQTRGFKTIQTKTKNKWREMIILNLNFGFEIIGSYTDEKGEPKLILEKKL